MDRTRWMRTLGFLVLVVAVVSIACNQEGTAPTPGGASRTDGCNPRPSHASSYRSGPGGTVHGNARRLNGHTYPLSHETGETGKYPESEIHPLVVWVIRRYSV